MGKESAVVLLEVRPNLSALPLPAEMLERLKTRSLAETWILVNDTWYKKPIPRGFAPQDGNQEGVRTLGDVNPDGTEVKPQGEAKESE